MKIVIRAMVKVSVGDEIVVSTFNLIAIGCEVTFSFQVEVKTLDCMVIVLDMDRIRLVFLLVSVIETFKQFDFFQNGEVLRIDFNFFVFQSMFQLR